MGEDGGEGRKDGGAYVGGFEARAVAVKGARRAPSRGRYTPHCTLSAGSVPRIERRWSGGLAERGMWLWVETALLPNLESNTSLSLPPPPWLLSSSGQMPRGPELPSECRRPASLGPAERESKHARPPEPRQRPLHCTPVPPGPSQIFGHAKRSTGPRRCPLRR